MLSDFFQVRINRCGDQAYITPQALISVLKIDSFSSPKLLPESQCSVAVASLKLVLHNHLHFAGRRLTGELADLAVDPQLPEDQPVVQLVLAPVSVGASIWPEDKAGHLVQTSVKTRLSLEYVDYTFLGVHHFVKPADVDVWVQQQDQQLDLTAKLGHIDASLGPFLIHSLRQSAKVWRQVLARLEAAAAPDPEAALFIPLSHMMVVNETGQVVRFGQAGTDEEIPLQPKHVSMYCWRTNKASQKLRLGLGAQNWSEAFSVNQDGSRLITVSTDPDFCSSVILDVERKSPTFMIVKFCGLLNILNLLKDHLELRFVIV